GRFGAAAQRYLPLIIQQLNGTTAWAAAIALGDFGKLAEPAVPGLIRTLESTNDGVRNNAANALGKIGPGAKAAIPALRKITGDKDAGVRLNAALALWRVAADTNVVGLLVQRLQSPTERNFLEQLNEKSSQLHDLKLLGEIGPAA